jgi:hypothetical protein
METLKARRSWSEVFWALNEKNFNPKILYQAKLSFRIDGAIKVFYDKQKLTIYYHQATTTKDSPRNPAHRMKANKTMKGQAVSNHRRKEKESESNIDSAAYDQSHKKQNQLNGKNRHIPININTECQQTQLLYQ